MSYLKCLPVLIFALSSFAFASEYEERAREAYQQSQQLNAARALQGFAIQGESLKRDILKFARHHLGLADEGQCNVGTNYSCEGALCTPLSTATLPVSSLGTVQGATFYCDINTNDKLACHVEYGPNYKVRAIVGAICIDEARHEIPFKIR